MLGRIGILATAIVGAGILAYQIGARLSDEALMTIAGVACGIIASIPVSIGLALALTRERARYPTAEYIEPEFELEPATPYAVRRAPSPQFTPPQFTPPQIIVVAPPQGAQTLAPYNNYFPPLTPPALSAPMRERTFKIVGEEDED